MSKDIFDVNGSKVFVENGKVKTVLNEEVQKTGFMSVEEGKIMTLEAVKMTLKLNGKI